MKTYGEILCEKKLFIFDLDGTVYLGGHPFDFAIRFIEHLRHSERDILFFTNNASHSKNYYMAKLSEMGFSPSPCEIMTAGDVTAEFLLRNRAGKSVYLVGTSELRLDWRERGVEIIGEDEIRLGRRADIVVSSFDTELTYEKLKNAVSMINGGAEYICTHPDFNCPTEYGPIPDSGSIAALLTASTGAVPKFFGKPHRETVEMIREVTRCPFRDIAIFGDRLYTDIALGVKNGITSVLVLTGETTASDLSQSNDTVPDIVLPSLKEADAAMFGE
ncbi:MAG: HAD-IIA family hydrolase [Firmicutes bacterium]|nr:HAD-IIA family hydrolase [Bacillota bacterium]